MPQCSISTLLIHSSAIYKIFPSSLCICHHHTFISYINQQQWYDMQTYTHFTRWAYITRTRTTGLSSAASLFNNRCITTTVSWDQISDGQTKYKIHVINSQHASLFYCYRCQQNLVPGQRGADNGVTIGVEQSGEWTAYRLGGHNTALCAFLDPAANSFGEFLVTKTLMQQFLLSVRNCYKVTIMSI